MTRFRTETKLPLTKRIDRATKKSHKKVMLFLLYGVEFGIAISAVKAYSYLRSRTLAPLPPGPKGLPLIGNIADLPKSKLWETFSQWGDIYGGMVYIGAFGKSMIILNDPAIAVDLLDEKREIYSDRPNFVMAGELTGWNESLGLIPFDRNGPWSDIRRNFAQYMGSRGKVSESFSSILHAGVYKFSKRLLDNPADWTCHIRMYSASTALIAAYGYKVEREDDDGAFLVDVIPILRYVPAWFPGAGWKRKVPVYKADRKKMIEAPFEWAKQKLKDGIETPGFVPTSLANNEGLTPEQRRGIKMTATGMYGGATDTTLAGVQSFFHAMVLFPSVQVKAQAEIDVVIGSERLPTLEDRPNLPYVEALYREVLRFYPFVTLSIPHVVREDDIHNGYFIPKGTTIIPNVWRFMRDPNKYSSPEKFFPERSLSDANNHSPDEDPRNYIFGFGRRICPGRHLGDASMWIATASVLAAFRVSPTMKGGKPVIPNPNHPESFDCSIKIRSATIDSLLRSN
ncbi:cytochrome P450 [Cyathus striatus]|nr:cytochrome P450 [Cyathus striatus]